MKIADMKHYTDSRRIEEEEITEIEEFHTNLMNTLQHFFYDMAERDADKNPHDLSLLSFVGWLGRINNE